MEAFISYFTTPPSGTTKQDPQATPGTRSTGAAAGSPGPRLSFRIIGNQISNKGTGKRSGKAGTEERVSQGHRDRGQKKAAAAEKPRQNGASRAKTGQNGPGAEKGAYYQRFRNEQRPLMGVEPSGAQRKKRAFCAPGFFLLFRGKPRAAQEPAPEGRKRAVFCTITRRWTNPPPRRRKRNVGEIRRK